MEQTLIRASISVTVRRLLTTSTILNIEGVNMTIVRNNGLTIKEKT